MLNSGPFRQLIWIVEDDGPRVPPVVTLLASALNRAFEIACPDQASPPTFSAIQREF